MDPRFLPAWQPIQPTFDFLSYGGPHMTEARQLFGLPSQDGALFAMMLRVHGSGGRTEVFNKAYAWWTGEKISRCAALSVPPHPSWEREARALALLAIDLVSQDRLARDIAGLLESRDVDTRDFTRNFDGSLFLTAAGALLIRDNSIQSIPKNGGEQSIFPVLARPASEHERLLRIRQLEQAVQQVHMFQDIERAADPKYHYQITDILEV